jgi:hypothetical protein
MTKILKFRRTTGHLEIFWHFSFEKKKPKLEPRHNSIASSLLVAERGKSDEGHK